MPQSRDMHTHGTIHPVVVVLFLDTLVTCLLAAFGGLISP